MGRNVHSIGKTAKGPLHSDVTCARLYRIILGFLSTLKGNMSLAEDVVSTFFLGLMTLAGKVLLHSPKLAPTALLSFMVAAGMTGPTPPEASSVSLGGPDLILIYTFDFCIMSSSSLLRFICVPAECGEVPAVQGKGDGTAYLVFRLGAQRDFGRILRGRTYEKQSASQATAPELALYWEDVLPCTQHRSRR